MPVDINLPLSPVTCIVAQRSHNKVAMVAEMLLHMLIAYSIIIHYYGYCHNIHITVDKNFLACIVFLLNLISMVLTMLSFLLFDIALFQIS